MRYGGVWTVAATLVCSVVLGGCDTDRYGCRTLLDKPLTSCSVYERLDRLEGDMAMARIGVDPQPRYELRLQPKRIKDPRVGDMSVCPIGWVQTYGWCEPRYPESIEEIVGVP